MPAESSLSGVDRDTITDALLRSGVLSGTRVQNLVVDSARPTLVSRIVRLRLEYDGNAAGAPVSLILKTGLPGRNGHVWPSGRNEVAFYTEIAPAMSEPPVPRCFDAKWDADTGAWYLLLEDLTDTHDVSTTWPLPPTRRQCELILDARARFHAAWWDDPRLGGSIGTRQDDGTAERYVRDLTAQVARFADRLGDDLGRERRAFYDRFLDAAPRLMGRHRSHRNVTLAHGDAHVWNVFLPRDPRDGVRLFDWDAWSVNIPTGELAYMMATHWHPDRRHRLERPLLDHYHAVLLAHGVRGYDRAALGEDYRLAVLLQIVVPVRRAASDLIPPMIWWNHFERIMLAVDDLGCHELLA